MYIDNFRCLFHNNFKNKIIMEKTRNSAAALRAGSSLQQHIQNEHFNKYKNQIMIGYIISPLQYSFQRGNCSTKMFKGYADQNYVPACRTHDACYRIYKKNRMTCDRNLKNNIKVYLLRKNLLIDLLQTLCKRRGNWGCGTVSSIFFKGTRWLGKGTGTTI